MDLSGNDEWDFSRRNKRNEAREWILRCKPLLVVGPDPGVVVRNAMGRADVKDRNAEHQAFMMEVIEIQREGRRCRSMRKTQQEKRNIISADFRTPFCAT